MTSDRASRPLLFIVDQDAALTTRARKGVRTLFASPIDLTATAVIRFVLVRSELPATMTVSCLLAPRTFDGALRYDLGAAATTCLQYKDGAERSRSKFAS